MSVTVVLVRHGHVEGIDQPRFRGRRHLALTGVGLQQAEQTSAYLRHICRPDMIASSPLTRCVTTAAIIGQPLGLSPLPEEGLIDRDYGDWQGRLETEVEAADSARGAAWRAHPDTAEIPNGESLQAVSDRVGSVVDRLVARHAGGTVVIVGHDTVNRIVLLRALDMPLSQYGRLAQSPSAVSELRFEGERWVLHSMNETAHLVPGMPR